MDQTVKDISNETFEGPFELADDERSGLPAWTYFNDELLELEKEELFRRCWQLAGHVSEVPDSGDYKCFDLVGERALIVRGQDGTVRAFHNVCRHRGSRVVANQAGHCKSAIVCPFHGWSFNLDGTLRAVPRRRSLPQVDPGEYGLFPVEMEIWHGFIFVRFKESDQPSVAELMAPHEEEIAPYRVSEMKPLGDGWTDELKCNWKAVRDVDNEGYHVPIAHPSLFDLYGNRYWDERFAGTTARSTGPFDPGDGKLWSVRHYKKMLPEVEHLPEKSRRQWVYFSIFPNTVIMFYPDCIGYYREMPVEVGVTRQFGRYFGLPTESREMKVARYLSRRIDRVTTEEDAQLIEWSWEAMQSSGYDGFVLTDLETGVRDYHDLLRKRIPVFALEDEPATGAVHEVNDALIGTGNQSSWKEIINPASSD